MNKPISMLINDAKINITKAVNESGLLPCLIQPIVKEIYEQVLQQCQAELQNDVNEYNASSEKEEDNDSEK